MSNEITQKVRMTIEVEMEDYQRDQLEISKNTQVLGGNIVQLDWEGGVFDEVDGYRKLFEAVDSSLMGIAFDNMEDEAFIGELQLAIKRVVTPIIKAKRKAILEGKMSENNGWIKCSERLPKLYHTVFYGITSKDVLLYGIPYNDGEERMRVFIGHMVDGNEFETEIDGKCDVVTHWQPLPEPPEE